MGYREAVLLDRPSSLWPMQENVGPFKDFGPLNQPLSLSSGAITTDGHPLLPGDARRSVGVGTGLIAPASSTAYEGTKCSFEVWVYADTWSSGNYNIISKGGASTAYFMGMFTSTGANPTVHWDIFRDNAGNDYNNPTIIGGSLTTGKAHHLVGSLDTSHPNLVELWFDAVLVGYASGGSVGSPNTGAGGTFRVGSRVDGALSLWPGQIGWVAFYPYRLSPAQVAAHYAAGRNALRRTAR